MAVPYNTLDDLFDLALVAPDTYEVAGSPNYPWGRVYGGQVIAQGLWAAGQTVEPGYRPHSVHAYFIRGGDADLPITYEVDRIRDGRSFVTRRVVARQANKAMLNLAASFQIDEPQADVQLVHAPASLPTHDDSPPAAYHWSPFLEQRWVPDDQHPDGVAVWMRVNHSSGDDPLINACALAYMSDDAPTGAAARHHPDNPNNAGNPEHEAGEEAWANTFVSASLDHSVWFHRPIRADQWQLHILDGHGITGARGLAMGNVFGVDGTHHASVAQEILIRSKA